MVNAGLYHNAAEVLHLTGQNVLITFIKAGLTLVPATRQITSIYSINAFLLKGIVSIVTADSHGRVWQTRHIIHKTKNKPVKKMSRYFKRTNVQPPSH